VHDSYFDAFARVAKKDAFFVKNYDDNFTLRQLSLLAVSGFLMALLSCEIDCYPVLSPFKNELLEIINGFSGPTFMIKSLYYSFLNIPERSDVQSCKVVLLPDDSEVGFLTPVKVTLQNPF
jgi:hypothetical protein